MASWSCLWHCFGTIAFQKICPVDEKVNPKDIGTHIELCKDALNYVDDQTCLICDIEFDVLSKALKHIRTEHQDIIIVSASDTILPQNIKGEVKIELKEEFIDENNLDVDFKTTLNDPDNSNVNMDIFDKPEPIEITTIFKCPICLKKYLSYSDVETHISGFHRIPLEVQRQSILGGVSTAIIQENL